MEVIEKASQCSFMVTMIYASNDLKEREELWGSLRRIAIGIVVPWVIGGDFNCVTQSSERLGEDCGFLDMQATGAYYTWNNKQKVELRTYSRLDRVFHNREWMRAKPGYFANFLPEGNFDHTPFIIREKVKYSSSSRPFKYFNMWSRAPNFREVVNKGECFSDIENKADIAYAQLIQIQEALIHQPGDQELIQQEHAANENARILQTAKTEYLKQKAKAHWLSEGDSNTSYFHGIIKARRNSNSIYQIKDHEGQLHKEEKDIQQAFLKYYQMLLGSKSNTIQVNEAIVRKGSLCNEDHAQILLSPVTRNEVKEVMFSIPNDKAPGPDGYSSKFFKDSWNIVGNDVINAVLDYSGQILKQLNTTLVTLIPKKERPESVLEYRPIACCNVIYKCISKLICNRLTKDFLDQMMKALNMPENFRGWIMQCVTTDSYSLNLNGNVFGFFQGKRGLRQGGPLSPLLFTICMEYLSRLLAHTTSSEKFRFHPLCKPMSLSHLMFADDLLLFSKGNTDSMMILLKTFSHFSHSSGPKMSKGKSNVYFNGVKDDIRADILKVSGLIERVINKIECICRNFLWNGGVDYMKAPLVSWEKTCRPKQEGGLGLRNDLIWNRAAIGKLVWWLAIKTDRLWVKWIQHIYLKGRDWLAYEPPASTSWYWRKICQVKSIMKEAL
ncbi:uncharacterized protein LOC141588575 [Silene latifolia]|uniref:uncharacterized protein LOC141588575 n=1 Tax=Silene latifolia TaxID=37657 RepID=UPI003D77F646